MSRRVPGWGMVVALVVASATAAAHSIDLGRIFGAGRDLATAATGLDEKEEIAVGREVAGRTLGAAPLVEDAELQASDDCGHHADRD